MMYFPQTGSIIVSTNNQSVSVSMIEVNILIVWQFDRFQSTTCPYHPFILLRTSLNSNSITMRLFKRVHSDNRFYWTLLITRFAAPSFFFLVCVTDLFYSACKRSLWEKQTNRKYFRLKTKLGFRIKTKFSFRLKTNTCSIDDLAGIFYLNSFKFSSFNTKIDQRFICFSFFRPNSSFHSSLFCFSLFLEEKSVNLYFSWVQLCAFPL